MQVRGPLQIFFHVSAKGHNHHSMTVKMMTSMEGILLLLTTVAVIQVGCDLCPEDSDAQHSAEARLRKKLLCNYDPEARPVKDHNTPVQVVMDLIFRQISVGEREQSTDTVTVKSWVVLEWGDEYLTWNQTENDNITEIRIFSDKIWVPEIILYSSEAGMGSSGPGAEFPVDCVVRHDGHVVAVSHGGHVAVCDTHLAKWPYDRQNCSLIFRTWLYRGEHINITHGFVSKNYTLQSYRPNRHWELEAVDVSRDPGGEGNITYPALEWHLVLKRHTGTEATLVTTPAMIMIALTLTAIMHKAHRPERIYLLGVNLLSHFLYLEHLSWYLPLHGDECPLIILFYRDSMVITTFVLITTAILKNLLSRKTSVPIWIGTAIAIANSPPGKCLMYATDDCDDMDKMVNENTTDLLLKEEQRNRQDWKNFVKITNRCLLLGIIITYLGLFIAMVMY